jgi:tetratricopeptide (TPR) repeat protein
VALAEQAGETHTAARASTWLSVTEQLAGRVSEAIERMERAYGLVAEDEPDADVALLLSRLGSAHFFAGNIAEASAWMERALDVAEALALPEVLLRSWVAKATVVSQRRPEEARGLLQLALERATQYGNHEAASRAAANLSDLCFRRDQYAQSLSYLEQALGFARRLGIRGQEWFAQAETTYALFMLGRWDESLAVLAELPEEQLGVDTQLGSVLTGPLEILLHRGDLDAARRLLVRHEQVGRSDDLQAQGSYAGGAAAVRFVEGNLPEALASGERAFALHVSLGIDGQDIKQGFLHAVEAALALGRRERAEELIAAVDAAPPGLRPPYLAALGARFRARLAGDDPAADTLFATAAAQLRALELPFHLAVCRLEHAEWLAARGRDDAAAPLLAEAGETFGRLGASPWLTRTSAVLPEREPVAADSR